MEKKPQQHPLPSAHKVAAGGSSNKNKRHTDSKPQIVHMKFDEELKTIGGRSGWLAMVVAFMCFPTLSYVMLHTAFAKISALDFKTRCRIPLLENKSWSFEQMQHICAPWNNKLWNCTYFKYNYTVIAQMDYEEASLYVETIKPPEIAPCKKFVHEGGSLYSVYKEFSLVCNRAGLEEILNISPVCGQIMASISLLPLADLVGRKRVIKWGANLFTGGALVMCIANTAEILVLGRFLTGMAYTLMVYSMGAIVVEIANIQLRPLHFIMMHTGTGFGFIAIALIATKIQNWHLLQWTVCSVVLVLPLTAWIIPESPRWLMSKGKRAQAWAIMKTLKDPTKQSDLLLHYRNEKRGYWEEIEDHITEYKPFFSKLIFLILLGFIGVGVYFKSFIVRFQIPLAVSRSDYFMMSGVAELVSCVSCVPLLLIFGRKQIMEFLLICSGFGYLFVAQLESGTINSLIFVLITELTTSAVYLTSLLYINEIAPTSHRCITTGLAHGFGGGLSTIIIFHLLGYFTTDRNLFTFLSCLCFMGVPLALLADETEKKDIRNTVEETIRPHEN